jgi:hypothetical protein
VKAGGGGGGTGVAVWGQSFGAGGVVGVQSCEVGNPRTPSHENLAFGIDSGVKPGEQALWANPETGESLEGKGPAVNASLWDRFVYWGSRGGCLVLRGRSLCELAERRDRQTDIDRSIRCSPLTLKRKDEELMIAGLRAEI